MPGIASRTTARDIETTKFTGPEASSGSAPTVTDLRSIGGLAYLIEATESMKRIVTYFLRQNVNFRDEREITSWLTRFKELDLRLVQ